MNNLYLLLEILVVTYPLRNSNTKTDKLYENVFSFIKKDVNIPDYDQLKLIIDLYIKSKTNNLEKSILDDLSMSLINNVNNKLCLRELKLDEDETDEHKKDLFIEYSDNDKILIWYYLCRYVSTDLISINYISIKNLDLYNFLDQDLSYVSISDKILSNMLKLGVSENHVHLNGGISFENQFWYLVGKRNVQSQRIEFLSKNKSFNLLRDNDIDWEMSILSCILVRYYMMDYIKNYTNIEFAIYLNRNNGHIIGDFIDGNFYNTDSDNRENKISDLKSIIEDLDKYNCDFEDFISIFADENDLVGKQNEYYLLFNCLNYIHYSNFNKLFYKLFWNYVRFKNLLLYHKVESDLTKGLSYFSYFFSAQNGIIPLEDRYKIILNSYLNLEYVRYLELRKSINNKITIFNDIYRALINDVIIFVNIYRNWVQNNLNLHKIHCNELALQVGLVYHFQRIKTSYNNVCLKDYFNVGSKEYLYNYKIQYVYELQLLAIQKLRHEIPELNKYIVGIDVAGNEHNIDPYIFTPIYFLNRNKRRISSAVDSNLYKYASQEIGFTFHVGEVFNSIVSGFRHIDEVIEYCQYKTYDRLGHATAIIINLREYLKNIKVTKIPVIEYLENLLYLYILKSEVGILTDLDYLELKYKIKNCTETIFGSRNIIIEDLIKWYKLKFSFIDEYVSSLNCCILNCPNNNNAGEQRWTLNKLINASHCNYYLKKMHETIITIKENTNDYDFYKEIQDYILKKIVSKGIVIESNPVSNSRVGQIYNEFNIPISEVFSENLNEEHTKRAITVLCSDDPAVFNTNLIYQYVLLENQMLEKGYAKVDVINWLNEIRKFGIDTTFILRNDLYSDLETELSNIEIKLRNLRNG